MEAKEANIILSSRPGSGKSTVARHTVDHYTSREICACHVSDYPILLEKYHQDTEGKQFQTCKQGGFRVTDFAVYDEVLPELVAQVQKRHCEGFDLVVVEFARSNCLEALELFDDPFLKNSSFLFLDASIPICASRIHERSQQSPTDDDHFVPTDVLERYSSRGEGYYKDSVVPYLTKKRGISPLRIQLVDNNAAWSKNAGYIYQAVEKLLAALGFISIPDLLAPSLKGN